MKVIRNASGLPLQAGVTVAVDPRVIPLRTWVFIQSVGWREAQDTGGGIIGKHIDLYANVREAAALAWGPKRLCVHEKKRHQ